MRGLRGAGSAPKRPVAIDLYSGAGGLSLGLEQAGFDVVAAAELDPIHALTHRFNFPRSAIVNADLSDVDADTIRMAARDGMKMHGIDDTTPIDAVVGGPPCQGFSVGGVGAQDDARNSQLLHFARLVVELKPKVFLLENVAGLLQPRFAAIRAEAFAIFEAGGYRLSGTRGTVNALDFGVPQSRRRVLIMGAQDGLSVPQMATAERLRVTVGDALEGLPDVSRYRRLLSVDEVVLTDEDLKNRRAAKSAYARGLAGLVTGEHLAVPRTHPLDSITNSLRTVHTSKTIQRFNRTAPGNVERVSRLYRLAQDGVSRTLRAGTGSDRGSHTSPRPIHPDKPRVVTVREAARLHGYPDWFRFHATNWHGHRQVGNSVPPPLARAAGAALVTSLGITPEAVADAHELGDVAWLRQNRMEALATLATDKLRQE